jgi:hypothetical protein
MLWRAMWREEQRTCYAQLEAAEKEGMKGYMVRQVALR